MKMKQSIGAASVITVLGLGGLAGLQSAFAAPSGGSMTDLASEIAERFGVSQDEVQAVFDEHHEQIKDERSAAMQERLAQEVADGELTQEQADLIAAKQTELKTQKEAPGDADPQERRASRQAHKEELKTWAEENGIPLKYLNVGGRRGHGGPHGLHGPVANTTLSSR